MWFQYGSHWYFKNLEKLLLKFTGKKKPTATAKTKPRIRILREEERGWGTACYNSVAITPPPPSLYFMTDWGKAEGLKEAQHI